MNDEQLTIIGTWGVQTPYRRCVKNNGAYKQRKYHIKTNREQTTISRLSWCHPLGFLGGLFP